MDATRLLRVHIRHRGGVDNDVALEGELDVASHRLARRLLLAAVEPSGCLHVDLSRLTFIDLPGVRALVDLMALAGASDCKVELRGSRGAVARTFELCAPWAQLPAAAA